MQVPGDILLFNPGKPWHCTRNSVWSVCEIKTAQGTDFCKSWNMTGNISGLIRSRKGRVSILPGKTNLITRRNLPVRANQKWELPTLWAVWNSPSTAVQHQWHPRNSLMSFIERLPLKSLLPASSLHFPHGCCHHIPWWDVHFLNEEAHSTICNWLRCSSVTEVPSAAENQASVWGLWERTPGSTLQPTQLLRKFLWCNQFCGVVSGGLWGDASL